jgi:predicted lipoprotein with Yx(FWY)xxD motif
MQIARSDKKRSVGRARAATLGGAVLLAISLPLAVAGPASAHGAPFVKEATVSGVGKVLVTGSGLTLYRFTEDTTNTATCTGGCATVWPPLFLPKGTKTAVAGAGVKGLGTTKWSNGKLQVTFHGEPLYRYSLDSAPGQAKGQNVGGTWFVVHPTASSGTTKPKAPSGGYGY